MVRHIYSTSPSPLKCVAPIVAYGRLKHKEIFKTSIACER